MPQPLSEAVSFLQTRRSRPAKTLKAPGPDRQEMTELLTIAARTPDHGKLEPWRFIVAEGDAMARLADAAEAAARRAGQDDDAAAKARAQFDQGVSAVIVVESPVLSEKIPAIEQTYSAGAVCLSLLNGALASGWGANWLTGTASHDRHFCETALGLTPRERVAGVIHIGTETNIPPERPRPDIEAKTTWL